jgi:glycine cleavage system H protein
VDAGASGTPAVRAFRPTCISTLAVDDPQQFKPQQFKEKEMSDIPADLKYAASHEWSRLEADGTVTVGITDHAQEALGDVVYVELPEVGAHLDAKGEIAVVESVKAASDIYAPVAGTVIAVNEVLDGAPETVNQDCYGDGWFFKLRPDNVADLNGLLDAAAYATVCENDSH